MSKALDIIYNLSLWMPDAWKNHYPYESKHGPGKIVEGMSEEKREDLRELKSSDLANMRPDAVFIDESYEQRQKRQFSEDKLNFDKKVLGLNNG